MNDIIQLAEHQFTELYKMNMSYKYVTNCVVQMLINTDFANYSFITGIDGSL